MLLLNASIDINMKFQFLPRANKVILNKAVFSQPQKISKYNKEYF